ncbi:hypothetical protein A4E84_01560 [Streptomyces qaidamensis]|uniref:Uncharacterized protein n=1 Tax=Streptomyces qaidamensis TaxID=1783515 RepID=A0A143BT67_9ACTN|nr:hypothetical protein [Streptomyces qaidamensis]AMW08333.1 hypothetical protein A4E84_01560 [Streptomyces qaidamensis]
MPARSLRRARNPAGGDVCALAADAEVSARARVLAVLLVAAGRPDGTGGITSVVGARLVVPVRGRRRGSRRHPRAR